MQRWSHRGALILPLAVVGLTLFWRPLVRWFAPGGTAVNPVELDGGAPDIDHYTCSMHPFIHRNGPGSCPICGMKLVPVTRAEEAAGIVDIPPVRQQLIGVRTSEVVRAPLVDRIRAVGRVTYDETRLTDVTLKLHGWIERLYIDETGQYVRKGEPLFTLYSPELYSAEQDLLLVKAATGLSHAARERLRLWDLTSAQIDEIARAGVPLRAVPILAPASGYLVEKNVVAGAAVEVGQRLFRIAGLRDVWIEAAVYEADEPEVAVGQRAFVTLDYLPGKRFEGRVSYVYPYLDPVSRTGRVRVVLQNGASLLKPGMDATVELERDLGPRLQIPQSAVVYTGPRRLVFVDLGDGHFRPQEIQIGLATGQVYEVLAGLRLGQRVVTSGNFLISAESRIRSAQQFWEGGSTDGG